MRGLLGPELQQNQSTRAIVFIETSLPHLGRQVKEKSYVTILLCCLQEIQNLISSSVPMFDFSLMCYSDKLHSRRANLFNKMYPHDSPQ